MLKSGIGSYTFGTLNSNGGANFGGSQTGDHFDYTFGASTTAPSTARTRELYERRRHRFRQRDVLDRRRHDCAVRDGAERDRRLLHEQLRPGDEERRHGRWLQASMRAPAHSERDTATLTNGACGSFREAGRR